MNISEENKKIGRHFGFDAQSNQLIEECAELIQEVNKYKRATKGNGIPVDKAKAELALDNLKEEVADVEIMLEQIKDLLELDDEEQTAIKIYKVNRTKERMAG